MEPTSSPLRKFLKKEGIYDNDIEEILHEMNVSDPLTDFKDFTQTQWHELHRRAIVQRLHQLKDQSAKARLENKLEKLEFHWRAQSGIKRVPNKLSKSIDDHDEKHHNEYHTQKTRKKQQMFQRTDGLKNLLHKSDCFNVDLLIVLSQHGINTTSDFENITNMEWDQIEKEFRVLYRAKTQDAASQSRADKILKRFETVWRKSTGIKLTSITNHDEDNDEIVLKQKTFESKGNGLKQWMKKNGIWQKALYQELMKNDVENDDDLIKMTEKQFHEIVRKVRVERFQDLKDQTAQKNVDKLLVKFQKIWRKRYEK